MFVTIVDALRELLVVPEGVTKDDTLVQPVKALPQRLYAWPNRMGPQNPVDQPEGRIRDPMLRVSILLTLGSKGETRTIAMSRATSIALDDALEALLASLYDNRRTDNWWDAYHESIAFDAVRNDTVRGHGVNVALRLNDPIG